MDLTGRRHYRRSNASGFPGDHATQLVDQPEQVEMIPTFDDTAVSQTEQAAGCDRIRKSSRSLRTTDLFASMLCTSNVVRSESLAAARMWCTAGATVPTSADLRSTHVRVPRGAHMPAPGGSRTLAYSWRRIHANE
jgi:hypothetical protein